MLRQVLISKILATNKHHHQFFLLLGFKSFDMDAYSDVHCIRVSLSLILSLIMRGPSVGHLALSLIHDGLSHL